MCSRPISNGMDPIAAGIEHTPTLETGFSVLLRFLGEAVFQWVPSTVITLLHTGNPPEGVEYYAAPYGPATAQDALEYMQTASAPGVYETFSYYWSVYTALSLFVSLLLAILVVYCIIRIEQIRKHERMRFESAAHPIAARDVSRTQLRWNRIVEEAGSDNEQNWRLAILEADIMLNELLDSLGYKGETMADKMRQVERGDFNTIDLAWEAHRVRNQIAHEGSDFVLTQREARRVIELFRQVFQEHNMV